MRRYELQDIIDRCFQAGKIFHIYRNLDMMSIDIHRDEILHNNLCLRCFGNISDQQILEAEKDHRTLSVDTRPIDIPSAKETDMELQHTDDFFETSSSFDTEGACTIAHECEDNIRQILETIETYEVSEAVQIFDVYTYFKKPVPLPLLCRHPPPASGKDDDIMVLKNILDNVITKANLPQKYRILFGPDFKISNNVFKLMEQSQKYHCILPEFPVLHLRKSKITNLI